MPVTTRQIGPCFAAEVEGVDMTKRLSEEEVDAIHAGMNEHAVLVFHDQDIDDEQQLAFTQSLGDIEHAIGTSLHAPDEYRLPTSFADVSNLDKHNNVYARDDRRRLFAIGNRLWHSDSSFKVIPAKYSLLHARAIPSKGGNTEFAYMPGAYDALEAETKTEVEDLICEHSQIFSRQQLGFTDLCEHATQREFVYSHKWRVGDLVMWDNRQTMHRARPFPAHEPRDMRRTTLMSEGPTAAQDAA